MKSTQSELSIRTAFQSYRWPSTGELWFQSQRCQIILKAQGLGSTQQVSNSEGHVLNGIPTADAQGSSTAAPSPSPTPSSDPPRASASRLQAGLGEELVRKVGLPILLTLLCVGVCVHSLRHTSYSHTWLSGTLSQITGPSKSHVQGPCPRPMSLPAGHSPHATSPSGMAILSNQQ